MTSSSQTLSDDEIEYLSLLLEIIESRNWNALEYAIRSNISVFQSFARKVPQSSELNGMTMLHACVRFSPPPHIVQLLIDLVPESPSSVDCLRRCPLHVAAGTRASLPVIQMLTQAYPDACDIQDVYGKTPLTLTCDAACELFEGDQNSYGRETPSFQVVTVLLKASMSSVPLEDNEGMSALEHAIFSDAPIEVVKLLQHVTVRMCEVQQKRRQSLEHSESERVHESTDGAISAIPAKKVSFHAKK